MSSDHVLRLRRTDRESESVLVNVSQHGTRPLDLKLVASEGEHVYPVSISASDAKSLQDGKYSGSLEEWKTTLRFALLRERPATPLLEMLEGVETVCSLSGTTLTITIRKNIGGIHQRLGSIRLSQNDEEEINPFEWAATSTTKYDELLERMDKMQVSATKHQDDVAKLNKQLDDLIQAKKDHEAELLKKCAALLNTKKLKVRDQQRLLAGAKVDAKEAEWVKEARSGDSSTKGRAAATSKGGKRKAKGSAEEEKEEIPSADGGSGTDDDGEEGVNTELEREQQTPDRTDDEETADEDEEGFDVAPPARSTSRTPAKPQSRTGSKKDADERMDLDDDNMLLPRRELSFAKKNTTSASNTASQNKSLPIPKAAPDSEETDDEEL